MARDEDLGTIQADSVKVQRIEEVISATQAVTQELEAVTEEVEKMRVAQEIILGQEV